MGASCMVFQSSPVTGGETMTEANSVLCGIEQIFLFLFVLMVLVGIAGGNPSMVLKPVFDIVGQIVMALLSMLSTLLISLIRLLGSLLTSGIKLTAETLRNSSVTQNKR
jgi:hypothetical protein